MPEKGQRQPHLCIVQETLPTGDHIGDAFFLQALFQQSSLPMRTVEHGDIAKAQRLFPHGASGLLMSVQHIHAADQLIDGLGHIKRLCKGRISREHLHLAPCWTIGGQLSFAAV